MSNSRAGKGRSSSDKVPKTCCLKVNSWPISKSEEARLYEQENERRALAHAEDVETVEAEHESAASTSSPAPSPPSPNRKPQAQPMRSSKLRPFESPRTPSATMPSRTVKRPTSAQEIGDEYHPGLCLDGILYDLTIDRLSGKICTLAHVTRVFLQQVK